MMLISDIKLIKHSKMNLMGFHFLKEFLGFLCHYSLLRFQSGSLPMNVSDNSDDLLLPCMSSLSR
jgi:hypothetical protein